MANALTGVRLLLVLPFAVLMAQGDARSAGLAALALAASIATDLLDGPVARRRGTVTAASAAFDHTTDCLFVTSGLAAGAVRGAFPWILPALVAAAFTQYVVDSYWLHREGRLRTSRLGRYNGVLYFVPLAGDILIRLGLPALGPLVGIIAWGLVASTVLSMLERVALARRRRAHLGGPAERRT